MTLEKIAHGLVKLCKKGRFDQAVCDYYADDAVSIEPAGDQKITKGIAGIKGKGEWWVTNHKVSKMTVAGPFLGKDQFVVRFTVAGIFKPTKKRFAMDELAIYTVRRGKVVQEQFFYHAG
jgi:hypothetical protein